MQTDLELIKRVVEGDVDSFEQIVMRYERRTWALVASMVWDRDQTADLVQQAFLQAYANLESYDPALPFWPWLKSLVRNLAVDHLRARTREDSELQRYRQHLVERLAARDPSGDEERMKALQDCRDKMTPAARKVLALRYEKSLGFDDIAKTLGRTAEATQRYLSRLRVVLKECMERRGAANGPA